MDDRTGSQFVSADPQRCQLHVGSMKHSVVNDWFKPCVNAMPC
jgi:hypothetical protein